METIEITWQRGEGYQLPINDVTAECDAATGGAHRWRIAGQSGAAGALAECAGCGLARVWKIDRAPARRRKAKLLQFPDKLAPGPVTPAA